MFKWVSLAFDVAKFVFRLATREPEPPPSRGLTHAEVEHIQSQIRAGVEASRAAPKKSP